MNTLAINFAGVYYGTFAGFYYLQKVNERYRQALHTISFSLLQEFVGAIGLLALGQYSTWALCSLRLLRDYNVNKALECEDFFKTKLDELNEAGAVC